METLGWSVYEVLVRNWAMVAIGLTVTILVIVPALILLKYVRISLNIMRSTKPPLSRGPLDYERLAGETVRFPAYDGLELHGMIIHASPNRPRRGLVLFAHEFCSDMHSCARYCRPLQEVGYDVFTFNFRGHGESECDPAYTPRQWITDRELHDIRGALAFASDWLAQRDLPRQVGIFGISRGACAAICEAAGNEQVTAIVCDGVYSTDRTIEYFMRRWAYIFAKVRVIYENHHPRFWMFLRWSLMQVARHTFRCSFPSVAKAITRMKPRPMLFIHGQRDSYLPVELSRQLYALAPQPKAFWVAPKAKHNQAVVLHPERYAELTIAFFDRHLAGLQTPSAPPATACALDDNTERPATPQPSADARPA